MQIPEKFFVAKKRTLALRTLLMGTCAGICWALAAFLAQATVPSYLLGMLSAALMTLAAYLALKKLPNDRSFTLSPSLRLPAPLVHKGFDSASDPIAYWQRFKVPREHIFMSARSRSLTIDRAWFTDDDWQKLLCSLPPNPPIYDGAKKEWPHSSFIGLALLCLIAHWLSGQSDLFGPYQRLLLGAHNNALILDGEVFRVLSYAFLHKSDLHLLLNMFCLFLGAMTLRRGYTELSMLALISATTLGSVVVGDAISQFDLIVGSSGVVFGIFGFLVAAQLVQDKRLHPLNRVARHRFLYLLLAAELAISVVYHEYGGAIHVAGFIIGLAYYRAFEYKNATAPIQPDEHSPKRYAVRMPLLIKWFLTILMAVLLTQWFSNSYRYLSAPYSFAQQMLAIDDPTLTAIATLTLCDKPGVTTKEVSTARQRALRHLEAQPYNGVAIARADYWLGETTQALERIRSIAEDDPDDITINLWLAIEQSALPAGDLATTQRITACGKRVCLSGL